MKKYTAKPHAVDRALLRFGISSEQTEHWFNQLMQTARYIGEDGRRQVYDHKGKRIIIDGTEVVTVYEVADLPFASKVAKLVERELKKAKKESDKTIKALSIEVAEKTIDQATLSLNFLKAKSPSAKRSIQLKLEEVNRSLNDLKTELKRQEDAYKSMEIQSRGYMLRGGETA